MKFTITVNAITAAHIEQAEHASFYGIYGRPNICATALHDCERAVIKALENAGIQWYSFYVLKAHSIDTTGTKTPYLAEITAKVDIAA